jgi:hypothetical protein
MARIVVSVRYAAWLTGDLGRDAERGLLHALANRDARVSRLPRGLLVEAPESPGVLLEAVHRAALVMESRLRDAHPNIYYEMGPAWSGTLQVVFDPPSDS